MVIMKLNEFFDYKNQVAEDILSSPEIVSLINHEVDPDNSEVLMYDQVFPFEYLPETIEQAKTYICVDVDVNESQDTRTYYYPVIHIWVFTHKSLLRLNEGKLRVDELCSKICSKLHGSRFYGLGEARLYKVTRFAPLTDFQGKHMVFYTKDFISQYDPRKTMPSNRKGNNVNS